MIRINPEERLPVADILAHPVIQQHLRVTKGVVADQADASRRVTATNSPNGAGSPLNGVLPGAPPARRPSPEQVQAAPPGLQPHQHAAMRPATSSEERRNKPPVAAAAFPRVGASAVKVKGEAPARPRISQLNAVQAPAKRPTQPPAAERRFLPPNINVSPHAKDSAGKVPQSAAGPSGDQAQNRRGRQASRPSSARSRSTERESDLAEVVSGPCLLAI